MELYAIEVTVHKKQGQHHKGSKKIYAQNSDCLTWINWKPIPFLLQSETLGFGVRAIKTEISFA